VYCIDSGRTAAGREARAAEYNSANSRTKMPDDHASIAM
jgi:hypothetical protein